MLINEAYFLNTCTHIPNLTGCIKDQGFKRFMRKNTEDILCATLGVCLVNEIKEYLDFDTCLVENREALPEHLEWLIYGKQYEPTRSCRCKTKCNCVSVGNCDTLVWRGIIDEENRESYLSEYVYFKWMCKASSICCDNKEHHEEIKREKRIDAWNNMVGWLHECSGCKVGLYEFLKDHKEHYPTHEGTCYDYKNYLGI